MKKEIAKKKEREKACIWCEADLLQSHMQQQQQQPQVQKMERHLQKLQEQQKEKQQ